MKKLLVIDTFSIIYRYYFIFIKNPLTNSEGMNTSAVYGFLRTYFSLIESYPCDYTVLALDSTRDTFRKEMYKEYKENREHMPDDLKEQIPVLYELTDAIGIPKIFLNNYEADDIIGTIAEANKKNGVRTIIYSPDKDILQLVDENTTVISTNRDNTLLEYDANAVKAKRGVYPNRIIDLLALMGDASDNIPGVKGVGEKTALKLLEEYGSLDGIYENIDSVSGKLKDKLIEHKEMAYLSYKLATIEKNAPFEIEYEKYKKQDSDTEKVLDILKKLSLNQIQSKVMNYIKDPDRVLEEKEARVKTEDAHSVLTDVNYYLIENEKEFDNLILEIQSRKLVAVDFESTGLNVFTDTIIGISFSYKKYESFYLDLSGRTSIDKDAALKRVLKLFSDKNVKIIGHNLKYEYQMLKSIGSGFASIYFDTMLCAYLINSSKYVYSLDALSKEYLNYTMIKYEELTDKGKKTLLDVELKDVVNYACEDADITFRLYEIFYPLLQKNSLEKLFYDVEMPLLVVLAEMEYKGVYVSKDILSKLSIDYGRKLQTAAEKIYAIAGQEFNIQSPKQVADILFNKMGIPPIKKTQTGFSTDEEVLTELSSKYKIASYLMTYRKYAKLKNTYIDSLPQMVVEKTKRIHSSYNQTVTSTGRLSSSEPNLQNIPIRDEEGREIRRAFIAADGNVFIGADYSQIELRLLAHFSEDNVLLEAFKNNEDIHKKTAMKIFSVSEKYVTKTMRSIAKVINFSIIYGKTAFGLSKELGISRKDADSFIKSYFSMYSGVKPYYDRIIESVKKTGEARTMLNRKRDFASVINSKNSAIKNEAERMAVNTVIQGSAADLIKLAMIDLHKIFKKDFKTASLIMQVHDELVIEVSESESEKCFEIVKNTMENAYELKAPLLVEISIGKSWGDIH